MRFSALFAAGVVLLAGCDDPALMMPADTGLAVPAVVVGDPAPAAAVHAAVVSPAPDAGFEAAFNAFRSAQGLPPGTANARLTRAAQAHADDMVARGYFSHESPEGQTYLQRIAAQGYSSCYPVEDIANGQASPAAAVAEWAASPQHRANMAVPGTVEYGFGHNGRIYVLIVARVC